jgi:hypothetical protein
MKTTLSATVFFLCCLQAFSQDINFNLYSAYAFDDKVDSYSNANNYFRGKLNGGFLWGGGIEYKLDEDYGVEILYQRLDSEAPMIFANDSPQPKSKVFDYGLNYVMLGANRYALLADGKIEPYGGLLGGLAIFSVKNPEPGGSSTITKFAWGGRLGVTLWATEKIGIRFQTQINSAAQSIGGGAYFGTGGSGAAVSSYSSMLQFGLGGGLVFKVSSN